MTELGFKFDVFLSYNSKDKLAVENIARLLRDEYGLKAWLDTWNLIPGEIVQKELENALDSCQTFAIFIGESGIGPWENEEMRAAIGKRVRDSKRRVIPVLLPKAPDNKDLKLPLFLELALWVDFRSGLDDKDALYRLYCGVIGQAPGDRDSAKPIASATRETWQLAHPYPMPPNFTGREKELQILDEWLADDKDRLFILRALGGFGKSALAWQWINTRVDPAAWKKLVFWSFYEGDASFEHFVEETLKYLKLEVPPGKRDQVDALLKAMQGQKILLIMDGFERALRAYGSLNAAYQGDEEPKLDDEQLDCTDINAEIFLKSVCSLPQMASKVLMTTRLTPRAVKPRGECLQGCYEKELKEMDKADAVAFFQAQGIQGTYAEIEAACEPYGYHPLSLRLLAGRIAKDFENPGDIGVAQQLKIDGDIIQQKHHVLEVAYNSLPAPEQQLLSTIACFRSAVELKTIEAIIGDGVGARYIVPQLHDLVDRGLLHFDDKNKKFDMHPIVRRYAYDRLTAADRTGAHKRLVNYFQAIPEPEKVKTLEDLAPVIELYHHMVGAGNLDDAVKLLSERLVPNPLYFQFGAYQLCVELLRALFPDSEDNPPRLKKEHFQAWTLNGLANVYSMSGQSRRAIPLSEMQIAIREKLGEKKNVAVGLGGVADDQLKIGMLNAAERNLRREIKLCREITDERQEAIGHRDYGRVLFYRGEWNESEQELVTAEKLFEKEKNVQSLDVTWSYRALRFLLLARAEPQASIANLKSSIDCAQRALELVDEFSRTNFRLERDYVRAHWLLGSAYRANNELTLAEENLSKALNLCRQINLVEMEADILLDLARLYYACGSRYVPRETRGTTRPSAEAEKYFKDAQEKASEALVITERCGYVLQGADVNLFLAQYALEQEKDKAKARQYAETALQLATCDGPPYYYKVAYEEAERLIEKLKE